MNRSQLSLSLLALCCLLPLTRADVKLPGLFGDHMVLQQGQTVPVWGWADPGEAVTVTLGQASGQATAGAAGRWRVDLPRLAMSKEPQQLVVAGKNRVVCEDVLVGEVWLCSGQSNMQFGIFNVIKRDNAKDKAPGELTEKDVGDPLIRVFCLTKSATLTPLDDTTFVPKELVWDTLTGHWQTTPAAGTWNGFSAVGYLFGKQVREITGAPVGLIGSYWGGTPVQAWMSQSALESTPAAAGYVKNLKDMTEAQKAKFPVVWADYVAAMRKWDKEAREPYDQAMREWTAAARKAKDAGQPEPPKPQMAFPRPQDPGNVGTPASLFNGMVHPLIPYALKGAIWYQGETNVWTGLDYGPLVKAMIRDWRARWGQGDFPFLFVQVAGYAVPKSDPSGGRWAALREGQALALELPHTGMATAVDLADPDRPGDIHPHNKVDVAKRLGLLARNRVYGQKTLDSGPTFASLKIEGSKARVSFANVGDGLVVAAPPVLPGKTPNPVPPALTGFEIAGTDRQWQPAQAAIDGDSVLVWAEAVATPVAVRYAWADCPPCSLYNREGLPALPFRAGELK